MRTQDFIDQFNASLAPERPAGEGADFQAAYLAELLDCERRFDDLTADRGTVGEVQDKYPFNPVIYKAVNMGNYILGGSVRTVVAQPSRRLLYRGVTGKDRTGRKIELFVPDSETIRAIGQIPLVAWQDFHLGSVSIDSSRIRAIPSSVGMLKNFSELLEEMSVRANNEASLT
jgi:hypothetical protein